MQVSSSTRLRAHALSHTRINHLPRRRARSRSLRQQDLAPGRVMSSMEDEALPRLARSRRRRVQPAASHHDRTRWPRRRRDGRVRAGRRAPARARAAAADGRQGGGRPDVADALQRARSNGVSTNDGNLALALYLAGDDDCFWSPYRQALGGVDHLPLFWPAADVALLTGSPLAEEVESRKDDVAATTSALGLDDGFAVAEAHVLSRAFEFDRGKRRAMVPFADLLNTNRHQDRHVDFEFEGDAFVMRAIRSGIEGDEVTDSYGPKSNARYLLNYGFALEDNNDEAGRSRDDACLDVALPEHLHARGATRGSRAARRCGYALRRATMAVEHALGAFRVIAASDESSQPTGSTSPRLGGAASLATA